MNQNSGLATKTTATHGIYEHAHMQVECSRTQGGGRPGAGPGISNRDVIPPVACRASSGSGVG